MCGFVWTFLTNFKEKQEITKVGSPYFWNYISIWVLAILRMDRWLLPMGKNVLSVTDFSKVNLPRTSFHGLRQKKQKYYLWQFPRWVLWINQKQLKRLNQSQLVKWMTCCLCDVFVLAPNLKLKLNSVVRSWEEIKKWWELAGMLTWYCELQMSSHITIEIEFQAGVYGRVCEYM